MILIPSFALFLIFLLFLWNRHGARIPNYEDVVDLQVVLFQDTLTFNYVI